MAVKDVSKLWTNLLLLLIIILFSSRTQLSANFTSFKQFLSLNYDYNGLSASSGEVSVLPDDPKMLWMKSFQKAIQIERCRELKSIIFVKNNDILFLNIILFNIIHHISHE